MEKKLECVRTILAANYRIMRYKWKKLRSGAFRPVQQALRVINGLTFNRPRPSTSLSIVFLVSPIRSGLGLSTVSIFTAIQAPVP